MAAPTAFMQGETGFQNNENKKRVFEPFCEQYSRVIQMTIREVIEQREKETLAPYAALACESRGRGRPERERDDRTCYQRDADRILHSRSFRRLMHKTQVFLQPEGDHYAPA